MNTYGPRFTRMLKRAKRKNAEIVSGQGTPDVRIKMPGDRITVSVIIGGIREGCPVMASETVSSHFWPSEAVLLEDFQGPIAKFDKARIDKVLTALEDRFHCDAFTFLSGINQRIAQLR